MLRDEIERLSMRCKPSEIKKLKEFVAKNKLPIELEDEKEESKDEQRE